MLLPFTVNSRGFMEQSTLYEIIGYIASALVAISLMMSSILRLRILNMMGAISFVIYGLFIKAYPVALMNLFIVGINLYHLSHIFRSNKAFSILELDDESPYLNYVLQRYREDIERYYPGFRLDASKDQLAFMVMIDLDPVGLFVGEYRENANMMVELDYVIPEYRDYRVGRYVYKEKRDFFLTRNISSIRATPRDASQRRYLQKMGFAEKPAYWELHLSA